MHASCEVNAAGDSVALLCGFMKTVAEAGDSAPGP